MATKQSSLVRYCWIASRSLSSGGHFKPAPMARNDELNGGLGEL
jgi:hypothetical protein